ncbi:MAG: aminotransferase class I/II-fold pyridoxal phosphate-dependent enzyme, partial [Planctomycetota bacterium]
PPPSPPPPPPPTPNPPPPNPGPPDKKQTKKKKNTPPPTPPPTPPQNTKHPTTPAAQKPTDTVRGSALPNASDQSQPPAGGIGTTSPTYSLYPVLAAIHPASLTEIPRNPDTFEPPPAADLAAAWNDAGCALAFFVNPHAPSGRLESLQYLEELSDNFRGLLVIDEAYVDFAPHNAIPLIQEGRDNLVLLRSLSKGYALAGLRFGYAIAHPDRITTLDKARDSYNTDILSQVAATAALTHRDAAQQTWQAVISERTRLTDALTDAGWLTWPSHSNFILTQPPDPSPAKAKAIYQDLKANDILIRYFNTPGLADKLRISVGTPDQTTQLLNALLNTQTP